jgi:hypothetical protein
MADKRPPSDTDGSGADEGKPSSAKRVVDIDAARLERQKAAAKARLKETAVSVSAQIRALAPGGSLMGIPPGEWEPDQEEFGLPPFCPVRPLGRDGDEFFFLNASGGVSVLSPSASGKAHIDALFAGQWMYLCWAWGRVTYGKKGAQHQENYEAEKARRALFDAATLKGPWNMVDNVRGRGAWKGDDGRLILHVGDQLLLDGLTPLALGEHDGKLYPGRPRTPRPAEAAQPAGPESCGRQALDLFGTWNWSRPKLDPRLMLGWTLAAMVGGALDWRPTLFITGDKGTGKSTLQGTVQAILGDATVHAVETTAAGIYQVLKQDTLPVTLDELEADANVTKVKAVIELARVASSGGRMLRGGQDHSGRQFDLRCPFMFSAINPPPLQPQDRSRMAILNMKKLGKRKKAKSGIDKTELHQLGRELLRRVADWWPRLPDLLDAMRVRLMDEELGRHDGRGADTFGTLAAFAHIALSDDMPTPDELEEWARLLDAGDLAELESTDDNWALCLRHLLQAQPDAFRTYSNKSVGSVLESWSLHKLGDSDDNSTGQVKRRLADVGLGLVFEKGSMGAFEGGWLFVPNAHQQLNRLFDGSKWAGMMGADGVWASALRQADECQEIPVKDGAPKQWGPGVYRLGTGTVGPLKTRGTLLRLSTLFKVAGVVERDEAEAGDGGE